jgi:hypothetical protein
MGPERPEFASPKRNPHAVHARDSGANRTLCVLSDLRHGASGRDARAPVGFPNARKNFNVGQPLTLKKRRSSCRGPRSSAERGVLRAPLASATDGNGCSRMEVPVFTA